MLRTKFLATACIIWLSGASQLCALPLWEISGTKNQIRLLGSVHFLRSSDYPLPAKIDKSYKSADIIIMELDLGSMNPLETATVMQSMAMDPNGRSLSDALGKKSYATAKRQAGQLDIDLDAMQTYEPWYAALEITQLRLQQLGFDPSQGIEVHFLIRAISDGKELGGLETIQEQLEAMDSLPPDAQKLFLMQTLEDAGEIPDVLDDLIVAWRAGDTDSMERELVDGMQDQPELYEQLLVQRNENWSRQIAAFADDSKDYLIIVGAMHLVGEDSVLQMLDDMGYSSKQLR
jgi:uncharacterized protein YbaP (TraB family)